MSLVNLAHVCSHLNNSTKARLGFTSIPNSNLHLKLCIALQNDGFISSVVRGGPEPPVMHNLLGFPTANAETEAALEPLTQSNVATRRLWLGLKYWQSQPVLSKITLISKPTRRVTIDVAGLREVIRGERSNYVDGLRSPGESLYLSTDQGIKEARECVEKKLGGLVLVRVV
ncbi:ribosomal protein S8 [Aspergillus crustosus]